MPLDTHSVTGLGYPHIADLAWNGSRGGSASKMRGIEQSDNAVD